MDIRHLRYFLSVAKNLNFTAASRELHIDQSSLSKQISNLEDWLGVRLFNRNTRSVSLTSAGTKFQIDAESILRQFNEAVHSVRQAADGVTGSLSIGFISTFEKLGLPEVLKEFRKRQPDSELIIHQLNWGPLNKSVENHDVDLALTFSYGLEDIPGLEWIVLSDPVPLCVVVAEDHIFSRRSKVTIPELVHCQIITQTADECPLGVEIMSRVFREHGLSPRISVKVPLLDDILLLVESGMGITVQSRHIAFPENRKVVCVDIDECSVSLEWALAWHMDNENPLINVFREIIAEMIH